MAIRLKSLELHGYKTFANKTVFAFTEAITAIVGPNGSGKSNIADCMRWVLGEQSFSLLRAKKTEDMIFSGSEKRPRSGMASATILFDNADGWLPIDFSEVAITRKAYRDGQNEYLINGQRVRLKDVNELLANSGLAERTYTIIGQGLVDAALSLRADERRKLFEEAAGIGLYRTRREEALRRLDITQRNLERVQDILGELEPRLRSLERQMRRAKEYQQIQADLQVLLKEWYGFHWYRSQSELALAQKAVDSFLQKLENAKKSRAEVEQTINSKQEHLRQLRGTMQLLTQSLIEATTEETNLLHQMNLLETQMQVSQQRLSELHTEAFTTEEEIAIWQQRLAEVNERCTALEEELQEAKGQLNQVQVELEAFQSLNKAFNEQLQEHQRRIVQLQSQRERFDAQRSTLKENMALLETRLHNERAHLQELEARDTTLRHTYAQLGAKINATKQDHQAAMRQRDEIQKRVEKWQSELNALLEEKNAVEARLQQNEALLKLTEQSLEERQVFLRGAKLLQDTLRAQNGEKLSQLLHEILSVPPEFEKAIVAVLDEDLEALIWNDDPLPALELMAQKGVQGILLPLKSIRFPKPLSGQLVHHDGVLGSGAELVHAPKEWQGIVRLLLSRVLVVRDRSVAFELLNDLPSDAHMVTLDGEVFSGIGRIKVGGHWIAGGNRALAKDAEQISRIRKEIARDRDHIKKLAREIEKKTAQIQAEQSQISDAQRKVDELGGSASSQELDLLQVQQQMAVLASEKGASQGLITQLEEECARLTQNVLMVESQLSETNAALESLQHERSMPHMEFDSGKQDELLELVTHWKTRIALAEQAIEQWEKQRQEIRLSLEKLFNTKESLSQRLTELQDSLQFVHREMELCRVRLPQAKAQIERLRQEISALEEQIRSTEGELNAVFEKESQERNTVSLAEHNYAQARIVFARRQEHLHSLMKQIEDDLGLVHFEYTDKVSGPAPLPFDGMVETLPLRERLEPTLESQIKELKAQLRRMGPVNLDAEKEYNEVFTRYQFLSQQVEDLGKAEADVRQVIRELDEMMRKEFIDTFSAVSEEFGKVFHKLFSGGSAKLFLTDEQDPNQAGIEIEARLPGKRTQGLALLSGGERSLTAVALIFALLKVSPTPFCILDEVDAMLDEFNVQRFGDLLRELSEKTQFILITHNRYTVQIADILYGVTMGHDSSSQVLSLKLDEVERYVA